MGVEWTGLDGWTRLRLLWLLEHLRAKNDAPNIAALLPYKIGYGRLKGEADIFSLRLILRQITCSSGFQCSSPILLISALVMNVGH